MPQSTSMINIVFGGKSSGLIGAANAAMKSLDALFRSTLNVSKGFASIAAAVARTPFAAVGVALGGLTRSTISLNNALSNKNRTLAISANYYRGLVGQVVSLNRFINVLGSSVRQIGQGLQNFATVFSLYVSVPVTAFIGSMTKGLIEFQDRLIGVRRSTGLPMPEVERLGGLLQQYSLETATSPEDLALQAEAWGRLGITGVETIAKLTAESDKLQLATNLTSTQVVDDIGKIGAIYFQTAEEFADAYPKIGSALNELGQSSAVSETEILSAAMRVLPVAKQLNMELADVLALSTVAAERNASPERAGTQLSRALSEQASKLNTFAETLGLTRDETVKLIDSDPIGFFIGIADAIGQVDSATERVALTEMLFGGVGGKTFNAIAANLPGLYDALNIANKAYDEGTSLQQEYLRSTDSVKVQLGILRNNFRYLGYTIAEEVLPYITKFAFIAIAGLRHVTEAFKALDDRTKWMIIGFGLLIAVVGPLTLFLGSFAFSIGIITTGITALMSQIIGIGGAFVKFGVAVMALLQPFNVIRLAVLALVAAMIYMNNTASTVGTNLGAMVNQFFQWGVSLFSSFAGGISASATLVYDAVAGVIDGFVGLIEAFSPPKEGPLKNVDKWGTSVMEAYANGIKKASIRPVEEHLQDIRALFMNAAGDGFFNPFAEVFRSFLPVIRKDEAVPTYQQMPDEYPGATSNIKEYVDTLQEMEDASNKNSVANETLVESVEEVTETVQKARQAVDEYIITIGRRFSDAFAGGLRALGATATDMFSEVFSLVQSSIQAYGGNLGLEAEQIQDMIMQGADAVLAMMNAFQSGESVTGFLSGLSDITNGLASDIEAVVNAQLQLNEANEELERIRERLKNFDDDLNNEIAAISRREDLTMDERAALIRAARQRASARKQDLEDEREDQEQRVENLRNNIDEQKTLIGILNGLVFAAQKEKVKTDDSELPDISDNFDMTKVEEGRRRLENSAEELSKSVGVFFTKIERAKQVWLGFWNAIQGYTAEDLGEQTQEFWDGFMPGKQVYDSIGKLMLFVGGIITAIETTITKIQTLFNDFTLGGALNGFLGGVFDVKNLTAIQKIFYTIGYAFGAFARNVQNFVTMLEPAITNLIALMEYFTRAFDYLFGESNPGANNTSVMEKIDNLIKIVFGQVDLESEVPIFAKNLGSIILDVFRVIFTENTQFWQDFKTLSGTIFQTLLSNIFGILMEVLVGSPDENGVDRKGLFEFAIDFFDYLVSLFDINSLDLSRLSGILTGILDGLLKALNSIEFSQFSDIVIGLIGGIVKSLVAIDTLQFNLLALNIWSTLIKILSGVDVSSLVSKAADIVIGIINAMIAVDYSSLAAEVMDVIAELLGAIADIPFISVGGKIAEIVNNLLDALNEKISSGELPTYFSQIAEGIVGGILTAISEIEWGQFAENMDEIARSILVGIGTAIGEWLYQNSIFNPDARREAQEAGWWADTPWLNDMYQWFTNPEHNLTQEELNMNSGAYEFVSPLINQGNSYVNPADGGLLRMGITLPDFLGPLPAPRVPQEETEAAADEFVSGFNTRISSPQTLQTASSTWNNFGISLVSTTRAETEQFGINLGSNIISGVTTQVGSEESTNSYNEILFSLNRWLLANAGNLQTFGGSIGANIIAGIENRFRTTILDVSRLVNNNKNTMNWGGYDLGRELVRGVLHAIMSNYHLIRAALAGWAAIDPRTGLLNMGLVNFATNPYVTTVRPNPDDDEDDEADTASVTSSGVSVSVTVQGNVIGNTEFINQLTDAVIREIERRKRYS